MSFCTAIVCMDGRVQRPVRKYLIDHYGVEFVDAITAPGPNRILAEATDEVFLEAITRCLRVSENKHDSVGFAVVGHADCAGNPVSRAQQEQHTKAAVAWVRAHSPAMPVIALWVDEDGNVSELET